MTKPNTVQDLMINGIVTLRDVDRMACRLFSSGREMTTIIDGYVVTMPDFVELPDHIQQFIRKAISTATVVNLLDRDAVVEEMKTEEHPLPVEDDFDHTDTEFG